MLSRIKFLNCVCAVTLFALAQPGLTQETTPSPQAATNPAMQEMIKLMMPGDGHKSFARMAGRWHGKMRVWNSTRPEAPPIESAAQSESKLVLGGRFVFEEATGSVMGMPMQRISVLGFDNATGQYTLTFYSNLETATNSATGTADVEGSVLTLRGEFNEAEGKVPFKNVIRFEQDDVHVFESYRIMPNGKELKLIEQVMTRVK